ncbi:MAG TPA: sigma-70 family RNA polymerase sigma factor [Anaerolineae bacterium]|nr:sigma-70 family RNA polymerase sigma factor [Anaerolineae bacterium]
MNEPALIAAARKGDLDAFNTLVLAYQHQVYNLAYRIMGDEASAADATQEAFISAYKHMESFRGDSFKSWIFRIVTNACYDELRRRKRRPASSLEGLVGDEDLEIEYDIPDESETPETRVERRELAQVIEFGIGTLPPDQRITLVLSDMQGMSYHEIAAITGANLGTVKSRLSRARAKLRDYLVASGELSPGSSRPRTRQASAQPTPPGPAPSQAQGKL